MSLDRRSTLWLLGVAAAILVGALLAFGRAMLPGYENSWQHDDFRSIVFNPAIRGGTGGWDLLASCGELLASSSSRGVALATFAVDHWLWEGLDPRRFRITNLLIHVMNAFLVLALARTLSRLSLDGGVVEPAGKDSSVAIGPGKWASRDRGLVLAGALALLWCVHPIHILAVVYVVQREEALAAGFCLAAVLAWLQGRRKGLPWSVPTSAIWKSFIFWGLLSGVFLVLGLRSKPVAIVGVALIPLLELTVLQHDKRSMSGRVALAVSLWVGVTLLCLAWLVVPGAVWSFAFEGVKADSSAVGGHYGDWGPWRNFLTQLRVIWSYLSLLLLPIPSRLNVDHDVAVSAGLVQPVSTLISAVAFLGVAVVLVAFRKSRPGTVFCLAGGLVALAPSSSIVPLKDLMVEYRVYLTSALLAVALILEVQRWSARRPALTPRVFTGIMVAVVLLAMCSWQRCEVFRTQQTFWSDAHVKSPAKTRPMFNLGVWYGEEGKFDEAERLYRQVLELKPGETDARVNLAVILRNRGEVDTAIEELNRVIQDPSGKHRVEALANVAQALLLRAEKMIGEGELDQAAAAVLRAGEEITMARKRRPRDGRLVKIQESCVSARKVMALKFANVGAVAGNSGDFSEAERLLRRALTLDPKLEVAQKNLERLQAVRPRVTPGER